MAAASHPRSGHASAPARPRVRATAATDGATAATRQGDCEGVLGLVRAPQPGYRGAVHRVCVFAGSRSAPPLYAAAAKALGQAIARRGWGLVYGGASGGLMGVVADAALAAGANVQGVIPRGLVSQELAHPGLSRLFVVDSMHERKNKMHELSNAFVALPGGFGTLDETFEALTWLQLGLHAKPVALFDVGGFWQPLVRWIEQAVEDGFVRAEHARALCVTSETEALLDALAPRA